MKITAICTFEDWKELYESLNEPKDGWDEDDLDTATTYELEQEELEDLFPQYWHRYKREVLLWP